MTTIKDSSFINDYSSNKEEEIRKHWADGSLTSAQVVEILQKLNVVRNAELEFRTKLNTFETQLKDMLSDDEFI